LSILRICDADDHIDLTAGFQSVHFTRDYLRDRENATN